MKSLAGVYLKEELEEFTENGMKLYPFMLIFPNKRRIYYLSSKEEKDQWISAIKRSTGYASLHDFYELGDNLGKGKYGLVKAATHKKTGKDCAVKIIKKKELSLKDLELLKREIEVLKVC
jgi:serine/threonine protein kinase